MKESEIQRNKERQERLRSLARQTLEAYRVLNECAADCALPARVRKNGDGITRASALLEQVVAELKQVPAGVSG